MEIGNIRLDQPGTIKRMPRERYMHDWCVARLVNVECRTLSVFAPVFAVYPPEVLLTEPLLMHGFQLASNVIDMYMCAAGREDFDA